MHKFTNNILKCILQVLKIYFELVLNMSVYYIKNTNISLTPPPSSFLSYIEDVVDKNNMPMYN
jgi:hypothetical protein